MSERPHHDFFKSYEAIKYDDYSDLAEFVDVFDSSREELYTALRLTMSGEGGHSFYNAKMMIQTAVENYIEKLELLGLIIFEQIEPIEGVKAWATLVHGSWTDLEDVLFSANPTAGFEVADISDLQINAIALFDGMQKKADDNVQADYYDYAPVDLDDSEAEPQQDVRDEYGNWVIDEHRADMFNNISRLLESCPPELYEK